MKGNREEEEVIQQKKMYAILKSFDVTSLPVDVRLDLSNVN